ncbi:MAG: TIGR03435 family protein [Acidobacteriota bacterium]
MRRHSIVEQCDLCGWVRPVVLLFAAVALLPGSCRRCSAQTPGVHFEAECEVSTVKPVDANSRDPIPMGPRVFPGGRITIGAATLERLIELAYSLQRFQISGGPEWKDKTVFDVVALCPGLPPGAVSAKGYRWTLTGAERGALRDLLESRFHLRVRRESVQGPALLLTQGGGAPALKPTTKPDREPAMSVMQRGTIVDGEAFGINASLDDVAREFTADLQKPVVNKTGIQGSFDFHVLAFAEGNTDLELAVKGVAKHLGLEISKGTANVGSLVIESARMPDAN